MSEQWPVCRVPDAGKKNIEDYLYCKSLLFKQCKVGIANVDDENFELVMKDHTCALETIGFSEKADLRAGNVSLVGRPGYLGVTYDLTGLLNFPVEIDILLYAR